jgi:type VI protein secretion system component Hcp
MAIDSFIWFEEQAGMLGPKGETKDDVYSKKSPNPAFEINTWSFGIENPTSIGSATSGAGSGKAKLNEFTIKKVIDSASPAFFRNCVAGAHYKKVTLEMRKAGGDPQSSGKPFLTYTFYTVFTTGINYDNGDDVGPGEEIKFQYGVVVIKYQKQKADGTADGVPFMKGWNQIANKAKDDETAPDIT